MQTTTNSLFGSKSTALEVISEHRLHGMNAIVTGASSGIGIETARALASAGASVTLAIRDIEKGREVAFDIIKDTKNESVKISALDLGDLSSVCRFAEDYLATFGKLSILINNAGIMACPLSYSADGYELQFATNHLGHFLLTKLLKDALLKGAPSRVVSLSSIGHRRSDICFEDIHYKNRQYDKWQAYGQSKTANVLFAVGLTQKLQNAGVIANAVMPGAIVSNLQKHIPVEEQRELGWLDQNNNLNPHFKSPEQGAATSIWAAVTPELANRGGLYLEDCSIAETWSIDSPMKGVLLYALNPERAEILWEVSEQMVEEYV